ncbi:MAG: hypothetical protein MR573_06595, partial [Clostridiales bacterium]|nr:hypothetical protein [Clostridiales bacterium]
SRDKNLRIAFFLLKIFAGALVRIGRTASAGYVYCIFFSAFSQAAFSRHNHRFSPRFLVAFADFSFSVEIAAKTCYGKGV